MNILINASTQRQGGGVQVANFVVCSVADYPEHNFVIVVTSEVLIPKRIRELPHVQIIEYNYDSILKGLINGGHNKYLDGIVETKKIDKVFSIFAPTYWRPRVPHLCGFAYPQYIYKDSPFFKVISLKTRLLTSIELLVKWISFKRDVDVYITENRDVSKKLSLMLPRKKVYTVTNYYNPVFDSPTEWDTSICLPEFSGITLLTISASYPHKNLSIISKVSSILRENFPLLNFRFVITVSDTDVPELCGNEDVLFIGKVNINQCPNLYKQATIMFLPTLLECFSASYAEAMKMRVPILTSDLGFARGLCGDAAVYFNPIDPIEIAQKIYGLSNDEMRRRTLVVNGIKRLLAFDNNKSRMEKYMRIIENEVTS